MNKAVDLAKPSNAEVQDIAPPLLFEMIRSFVSLAATLNLSHSVKALNSTRQTVRRHISTLETAMGSALFSVDERQYSLTDAGRSALPGAEDILARGTTWLRGQSTSIGCLQHLKATHGDWHFYQEQQPLGRIWTDTSLLPRETFRAWSMSGGEIENPLFEHVRPYLIIYREAEPGWICVEFGQKSVYVNWFGQDFARSSIGRPISQMPAGKEFSHLLYQSFAEIQASQTARLDHVFTHMPQPDGRLSSPVCYQRLIMSGSFPDGSPAVMSLISPVDVVRITGLTQDDLMSVDPVEPLGFGVEDARFETVSEKAN